MDVDSVGPDVAVTYWVVEARPAPTASMTPDLAEIAGSLRDEAAPPSAYALVERVTLRSAHQITAMHEGRTAELRQTVSTNREPFKADLDLQHHAAFGSALRTRVDLPPGQPVVVGELDVTSPDEGEPRRLLYVVLARPTQQDGE